MLHSTSPQFWERCRCFTVFGKSLVRNPSVVEGVKPGKRIEHRELDELQPHPAYTGGVTPKDGVLRDCYRTRSAGSYPVVREDGTILNGHKRIAAAEAAGLEHHPVEVVEVTEEQARAPADGLVAAADDIGSNAAGER